MEDPFKELTIRLLWTAWIQKIETLTEWFLAEQLVNCPPQKKKIRETPEKCVEVGVF